MSNATCQKEASTLAGRLSVLGTGYAWNLSKPDIETGAMLTITNINRRMAGGAILTIPKAPCATGHYPVLDNAVMHGVLHAATFAHRVCSAVVVGFLESIKKGGISATPESVGQSAILHFGHSFGFLRCSSLSFRPQASSTQAEKLALGLSGFSRSTLASMSSISSFGNLIPLYVDLPFLFPVAISKPMVSDGGVYTKYNMSGTKKRVDLFTHHELTLFTHLIHRCCTNSEARQWWNTNRASNHNDRTIIEAAMLNDTTHPQGRNTHTQTQPAFTYVFVAIRRTSPQLKHEQRRVTACTEREARKILVRDFILVLASRIAAQAVSHG